MRLICRSCNIQISKELTELHDLGLLDRNDGQDYIPEGLFMIESKKAQSGFEDTIIINIKDLINSAYHQDGSRLNGCCGYDGLDGINRVCLNNHEIGTENSDCWMCHFVSLDPRLVDII